MWCLVLSSLLLLAPPTDFTEVWQAAGVSRSEARVDRETMALYGQGDDRLPLYDYLMAEPERVPDTAALQLAGLVDSEGVAGALAKAAWLTGKGVRRSLAGEIVAEYRTRLKASRPLDDAIARLRTAARATSCVSRPRL